jgi:hypothetical protein
VKSFFLVLSLLFASQLQAKERQRLISPNGKFVAVIREAKNCEARVEIHAIKKGVLAKQDHSSGDHEHGFCFEQGQWTPDSNYFVYSLYSSGGHSPSHSPVFFFSTRTHKINSLDELLRDAVLNDQPTFTVSPPDRVTIHTQSRADEQTISLATLESH